MPNFPLKNPNPKRKQEKKIENPREKVLGVFGFLVKHQAKVGKFLVPNLGLGAGCGKEEKEKKKKSEEKKALGWPDFVEATTK